MPGEPAQLTPRKPRKLVDHVVSQVKNYIYANGLKPGDRLPSEHDLAEQLKVSRGTLREAIKGLSVSGLLEARPRTGTRVREFAYEQIVEALVAHFHLSDLNLREILEARSALELSAIPYVAQRATPKQIEGMREIEVQFERATRANWNHTDLDLKLHAAFLAASGNRLLASMIGLLRAFFAHPDLEESIVTRHFDRAEQELTMKEHRLVIDAIEQRDAAAATSVMQEHFSRQLRWLEENGREAT